MSCIPIIQRAIENLNIWILPVTFTLIEILDVTLSETNVLVWLVTLFTTGESFVAVPSN